MKKILTIAVAVVLTLAMAIPAFAAIGWPAPDKQTATNPNLIDPTLTLTQLEYDASVAAGAYNVNGVYFKAYNASVCVVKHTEVRWLVVLTVPEVSYIKVDEIDKDNYMFTMTTTNLDKVVDGVEDDDYTGFWKNYNVGKIGGEFDIDETYSAKGIYEYSKIIEPAEDNKDKVADITKYTYMFTSKVQSTAKACVDVSYTCGQDIDDIDADGIKWYYGDDTMKVVRTDNKYAVTNTDMISVIMPGTKCAADQKMLPVTFEVENFANKKYKIIAVYVSDKLVSKGANNEYLFGGVEDALSAASLEYVLKAFGWTWEDCIASLYMYDCAKVNGVETGFCTMLNKYKVEASACWNPYTATLTCTDGVKPPQTGDATTVVGFVMIALALVAAAAVVVKKVRA